MGPFFVIVNFITLIFQKIWKFWPAELPEEFRYSSRYGDYELNFKQEPGKLIIKRKFLFKKGTYTGDEFNAFLDSLNKLRKFEVKKIMLSSKT